MSSPRPLDEILVALQDRAKELDCLHRVVEILSRDHEPEESVLEQVVQTVPGGWQYPECCQVTLVLDHRSYTSPQFQETPWRQRAAIKVDDQVVGELNVYYTAEQPPADEGPFLREERQLINALAERIGLFIEQRRRAPAAPAGHTELRPLGLLPIRRQLVDQHGKQLGEDRGARGAAESRALRRLFDRVTLQNLREDVGADRLIGAGRPRS